jgi:hypothetical protein
MNMQGSIYRPITEVEVATWSFLKFQVSAMMGMDRHTHMAKLTDVHVPPQNANMH